MTNQYGKIKPIAQMVAERLAKKQNNDKINRPEVVNFLSAMMSYETANLTNRGAKDLHNYSGIKYSKYNRVGATKSGWYANYPNDEAYANDLVRVLSLPYYKDIIKAFTTTGAEDDLKAWNNSPYAEKDYSENAFWNKFKNAQLYQMDEETKVDNQVNHAVESYGIDESDIMKIGLAVLGVIAMMGLLKD